MGAGRVWVSIDDLETLATHLNLDLNECVQYYVERQSGRWALKEKDQKGQCIFLDDQARCSVYESRPHQCRSFPWWPTVLDSAQKWNDTARTCEGIDHQHASRVPYVFIRNQLALEKQKRKNR